MAERNISLKTFTANAQRKSFTTAAVTIILVVVIFLLGIFPAVSSIFAQIQQNNHRRDVLSQIETKRDTIRALILESEEKVAVTKALEAGIPDGVGQEGIFSVIEEMARVSGVELRAINFNVGQRIGTEDEIFLRYERLGSELIRISVSGSRFGIEQFLQALEEAVRIYNVSQVAVQSEAGATNRFVMSVTAEIYYWKTDIEE